MKSVNLLSKFVQVKTLLPTWNVHGRGKAVMFGCFLNSKCSNHEEVIDIALENAVNFNKMWASGGWKRKVRMQYLLFPKGLNYNKRNDTVRTENINQAFLWMACQQQKLSQIKSGIPILNIKYSALVDPERFELSSKQGISELSTKFRIYLVVGLSQA